jgi:hypothetical protein
MRFSVIDNRADLAKELLLDLPLSYSLKGTMIRYDAEACIDHSFLSGDPPR